MQEARPAFPTGVMFIGMTGKAMFEVKLWILRVVAAKTAALTPTDGCAGVGHSSASGA